MKVLIIEDDKEVVKDISFCLEVRYPEVLIVSVAEGKKGIKMVEAEAPDLIILDSTIPDMNTIDILTKIREFSDVPLIILSESETHMEMARCLEAGADDFAKKPFSPIELLARIKALLRRIHGVGFGKERVLSLGNYLKINFNTHEVFISGKRVKLTRIEFKLLSELVRNEGRVLTHDALLRKAWGLEYTNDPSYLKKYIYRLRQKLEPGADEPQMLLTERGIGYRFTRRG